MRAVFLRLRHAVGDSRRDLLVAAEGTGTLKARHRRLFLVRLEHSRPGMVCTWCNTSKKSVLGQV